MNDCCCMSVADCEISKLVCCAVVVVDCVVDGSCGTPINDCDCVPLVIDCDCAVPGSCGSSLNDWCCVSLVDCDCEPSVITFSRYVATPIPSRFFPLMT